MTAYTCAGNLPKEQPCGAEIASEAAAERHTKTTGHGVLSAVSRGVLDRFLASAGRSS